MEVHHQYENEGSSGGSPAKHQLNGVGHHHDSPLEHGHSTSLNQRSRLPEPYDFRNLEKVEVDRLNGKYHKAAEFAEKRLDVLSKISAELLSSEEKFLEDENKMIEKAIVFIDENVQKFKELTQKEIEQKERLEAEYNNRITEFQSSYVRAEEARIKIKEIEAIIKQEADQLVQLNNQKEQAAVEIEKTMEQFKNIKIMEPRDSAHELFKWFLAVIYNESPAKYEFENFKNEVLKKDKGQDFIERLKGFRPFGLGKEEIAQTTKLLACEQEVADRINQKKKTSTAVAACFGYIKIINEINHLVEEMHKKEVSLEEAAKRVDLTGGEFEKHRSRKEDAQNSIQIASIAIETFTAAHRLFFVTSQKCRERQKHIAEALPGLKNSTPKPKKVEVKVEVREEQQQQGGEEETFGVVNKKEVAATQHKQVRSTYESDVQELPPTQKEGCKCTIF